LSVEHEPLPQPNNRLTLSDKKDWRGINKPNISTMSATMSLASASVARLRN
jgi:hypothetical protein